MPDRSGKVGVLVQSRLGRGDLAAGQGIFHRNAPWTRYPTFPCRAWSISVKRTDWNRMCLLLNGRCVGGCVKVGGWASVTARTPSPSRLETGGRGRSTYPKALICFVCGTTTSHKFSMAASSAPPAVKFEEYVQQRLRGILISITCLIGMIVICSIVFLLASCDPCS